MATATRTKLKNFIDGEFVEPAEGETEEVLNPATGEAIAEAPLSTAEDVNRAVGAASKAFGLNNIPRITSASASACPVNLIGDGRSDTANATVAASNQHVANRTSRQMIPTRPSAGGVIASRGSSSALALPRDASTSARTPKPSQ